VNVDPVSRTYTEIFEREETLLDITIDYSDPPAFRGAVKKKTEVTVRARDRETLQRLQTELRKRGYRKQR